MPSFFSQRSVLEEELQIQHLAVSSAKAKTNLASVLHLQCHMLYSSESCFPAGEGGLAGMERNSINYFGWFFVLATISILIFISHAQNNSETKTSSSGAQQILAKGVSERPHSLDEPVKVTSCAWNISKESGRNQEANSKSSTCYETKYTDMPCNNLGIGKGTLFVYVQATCLLLQQQVSQRMLVPSYLFHLALLVR